jgi:nicotinate-nucleotide--dimethylbenzimidazole phosphoribosyltransferase
VSEAGQVLEPEEIARFSDEARRAVYDVIALRRDIRHFRRDEGVDDQTLERILEAANLAPSVGFSQPWGFVVVRGLSARTRIRESFLRCREAEAARYPPERRARYLTYRLEGLIDSPVNVCVAVDLRPRDEAILGTTVQPEAIRASACCAVQNLWLSARAEGIGVGWVSIVEPEVLRRELAFPAGVEPVAYLCLGHPVAFRSKPMLEELGWKQRRSLVHAVHHGRWHDEEAPAKPLELVVPRPDDGRIPPLESSVEAAAEEHQARLTKPVGSLGRLEQIATWFAAATGVFPAPAPRSALALFIADHGVVVEGVSAYGSSVTAAMACNVMAGGAAASVLARLRGVDLVAVDVGIAGDTSAAPTAPLVALVPARIRAGTGNLRVEPAMLVEEARAALAVGRRIADGVHGRGARIAAVGEIGIGNTTSAAALTSVFTGAGPEQTCGLGTGIDRATWERKVQVVRDALALHAPRPDKPLETLAAVGGLEIAAIVGFLLRAAALRLPVVLDGFVTNAAALVARAMEAGVLPYLLASHVSSEPGAGIALEHLGLRPVLSLEMRLGEGTGALLALDVVGAAVTLQAEMSTFATAGVVRSGP